MSIPQYDMSMTTDSLRKLPPMLRYSEMQPLGVHALQKKHKFNTMNNSTYDIINNIIKIELSSSTAFLDPQQTFLKFTFKNTSGADCQFDGSAHTIIKRLRLISKTGPELEDNRAYGRLYNMLSDVEYSYVKRANLKYTEGYGDNNGIAFTFNPGNAAAVPPVAPSMAYTFNDVSTGANEVTVVHNNSHEFCLPIYSSLIGLGNHKYVPLFLTGPIELELTLSDDCTFGANATKYEISNVELHCTLIDFAGDINAKLFSMISTAGAIYMHSTQWSYFNRRIQSGNLATDTMVISEKLKSVKNILVGFSINRGATYTNRSYGRICNTVRELQVNAGNVFYPTQAIRGTATDEKANGEFIVELYKSLGQFANTHTTGIISANNFKKNDASTANDIGRAMYGIELESFSKQSIQSGLDTSINTPMNLMFSFTNSVESTAHIFVHHDVYFTIKDGVFTKNAYKYFYYSIPWNYQVF
jgi:hypothetical protein